MPLIDAVSLSKKLCSSQIQAHLKYATTENFIGRLIRGYEPQTTDLALMTPAAAKSLCKVQNDLVENYNYSLLVYDAYRPVRAVKDFVAWSQLPPAGPYELERKAIHYPHIEKSQLFDLGYVMEDSGHCYGNTVDVVLVDLSTDQVLDMGAPFDFMDRLSHITVGPDEIGQAAYQHRQILSLAMQKFGFHPYEFEFWHFSHGGKEGREVQEPVDVEITSSLKGAGVLTFGDYL